jgi:ankyrin repeat protein
MRPSTAIEYVSKKVRILSTAKRINNNALIHASTNGHIEIVRMLIADNFDPRHTDFCDKTALMYASENGHFEIVCLLLAIGKCDPAHVSSCSNTALTLASKNGHDKIISQLLTGDKCPFPENTIQFKAWSSISEYF